MAQTKQWLHSGLDKVVETSFLSVVWLQRQERRWIAGGRDAEVGLKHQLESRGRWVKWGGPSPGRVLCLHSGCGSLGIFP